MAALEEAPDFRVEAFGHARQEPLAARVVQGLDDALVVDRAAGTAHHDVLAHRQLVGGVVLEQHADAVAQRLRIQLAQIDAADPDRPGVGIVETQQ